MNIIVNKQLINEIKHKQAKLDSMRRGISQLESEVVNLLAQLPRLYYLEMTGHNGYEAGIIAVGTEDEMYEYVDTVLVEEQYGVYLNGQRDNQIHPKWQKGKMTEQWNNSGKIYSCTPHRS